MKFIFVLLIVLSSVMAKEYKYTNGDYFDVDVAFNVVKKTTLSIPIDIYNMALSPFQNPRYSLGSLGVVGGLVLVDKQTTIFYQERIEANLDFYNLPTLFPDSRYRWLMGNGADSWLTYGMAFHYLSGLVAGDEKSQAAAMLSVKATAYAVGITHLLLKTVTARERPADDFDDCSANSYLTCNPYDFGNWRPADVGAGGSGTAMPSFHTTMFFSVARVYAEVYDNYWAPYLGIGLLYASAIRGHQHWVSDLVAGGIVGTFIGHHVVRSYEEDGKPQDGDISIIPMYNGIGISYTFASK